MTKNAQSKQGVQNPTSPDIRCYQARTAPEIATVPAGSKIHYISTQQVNHPGPTQYYLAKVPAGASAKTWDGSGAVWFKIFETMPTMDANKQLTWPGQSMVSFQNNLFGLPFCSRITKLGALKANEVGTLKTDGYTTTNATIPDDTPTGEYLLRVEQIALHMASTPNQAQFYISCSQIEITGDGGGTPGPLVALPGAYKSNDPGILVNLYSMQPNSYKPPGPQPWTS